METVVINKTSCLTLGKRLKVKFLPVLYSYKLTKIETPDEKLQNFRGFQKCPKKVSRLKHSPRFHKLKRGINKPKSIHPGGNCSFLFELIHKLDLQTIATLISLYNYTIHNNRHISRSLFGFDSFYFAHDEMFFKFCANCCPTFEFWRIKATG